MQRGVRGAVTAGDVSSGSRSQISKFDFNEHNDYIYCNYHLESNSQFDPNYLHYLSIVWGSIGEPPRRISKAVNILNTWITFVIDVTVSQANYKYFSFFLKITDVYISKYFLFFKAVETFPNPARTTFVTFLVAYKSSWLVATAVLTENE